MSQSVFKSGFEPTELISTSKSLDYTPTESECKFTKLRV